MNQLRWVVVWAGVVGMAAAAMGEAVRLPATADIWVSDAVAGERNTSMGAAPRLKLKTIQEMSAVRFDVSAVAGREIKAARLMLKKASEDKLRWISLSTINQDWVEGKGGRPYGPADGATWFLADAASQRPWAWRGSALCDVIMGSGHSLASVAERRESGGGWISVAVPPELIYAMIAKDTDGLAIMDGGNIALFNNFVCSREQSGSAPYLEVETGGRLDETPGAPRVSVEAAPESATRERGAIRVAVTAGEKDFCYRVMLNGKAVERWRVPHPRELERRLNGLTPGINQGGQATAANPGRQVLAAATESVTFAIDDLAPGAACTVEVVAVARSGQASAPTRVQAIASAALAAVPKLAVEKPAAGEAAAKLPFVVLPPLLKFSPQTLRPLHDDVEPNWDVANAVWNGRAITLVGARGEYVSFQLGAAAGSMLTINAGDLKSGDGQTIVAAGNVELFDLHPTTNKRKELQPAYAIPLKSGQISKHNQVHVDLYIPKSARAGKYVGTVEIRAGEGRSANVPIELRVLDFVIPDKLGFWPELNAYSIPKNHTEYYRLAHQHRCVANYWRHTPKLRGTGKEMQVDWRDYDQAAGPLLSGKAFADLRRGGVPVECMYLPWQDDWPGPLNPQTYLYKGHWPRRGEDKKTLVEHSLTAPPIESALAPEYLDAFTSVQKQFVEHFAANGWDRTEMQCFFGGKQTHRIDYGSNMWWTTDEPAFWHDWAALAYFDRLWTDGIDRLAGDGKPNLRRQWVARADISRPQWQGRILDRLTQVIYFGAGAASSGDMIRRTQALAAQGPFALRHYGSCNADTASNLGTVAWVLSSYLNGADAALPWQTIGSEKCLEIGDAGAGGGNGLLVPAPSLGHAVVADLRLKALRDAEQLVEYLRILGERRKLSRAQVAVLVAQVMPIQASAKNENADDAEALRFGTIKAGQLAALKRAIGEMIEASGK